MDGDVLNQRVRKFRAPHAGMAQRAIALAVGEAAGNRLEGAASSLAGATVPVQAGFANRPRHPDRLTADPPRLRNPAASRSVSFA